ncbi:MAG: type VI secretion system baseplate subunit TssF [Phycisphaerales bacterium]
MRRDLVQRYGDELRAIRRDFRSFLHRYPTKGLELDADGMCADPSVERLLQATAFLSARVHQRLDDDLPELSAGILGLIQPFQTAPLPACSIAQFRLRPGTSANRPMAIPAGSEVRSMEASPAGSDVPVRFRTLWDIEVPTVTIEETELGLSRRRPSDTYDGNPTPQGELRIRFSASQETSADRITLYFSDRNPSLALGLFELLLESYLGGQVVNVATGEVVATLGNDAPRPVSVDAKQTLASASGAYDLPHALLVDYFAMRSRFLFLELAAEGRGDARAPLLPPGTSWDVVLFLRESHPRLEAQLRAAQGPRHDRDPGASEVLLLGCCPVVNRFPVELKLEGRWARSDHRVVVDSSPRREGAYEVLAVTRVEGFELGSPQRAWPFLPLYRMSSARQMERNAAGYWWTFRQPSSTASPLEGTELFIRFCDPSLRSWESDSWAFRLSAEVGNRDAASVLNSRTDSSGRVRVELREPGGFDALLVAPVTPARRAHLFSGDDLRGASGGWRAASVIGLDMLGIFGSEDIAATLRRILELHDFTDGADRRRNEDSREGLALAMARPVNRRLISLGGHGQFLTRGVAVEAEFDADRYGDGELFLFALVLARALSLLAPVNSFVELHPSRRGRGEFGKRWHRRPGTVSKP